MRVLLIGLVIIFVGGCYNKETISPTVIVRKTSKLKYEIQIKKHIEGRGNIHTLSLSKYEYDNSDWIYVNSLQGKIAAKDIVFSHYWACIEYPWSISNLKGHIEFTKDKLKIALKGPWYEDGENIAGYKELDINGEYDIIIAFEKGYEKSDNGIDLEGAPCNRAWTQK